VNYKPIYTMAGILFPEDTKGLNPVDVSYIYIPFTS